ncbi:MAG TPA: Sir2 family NAD-dependent protein deacetylase [Humisphaera sp.]
MPLSPPDPALVRAAADAIGRAQAFLVAVGAGMGVDSGLPDFRGTEGFWRAYPPYQALGVRFEELANPASFARDPAIGWGFYGHRLNLYRATTPHDGFAILRRWGEAKPEGAFVFTSNVDGHFQRAGFDADRVYECHGSIHHLQCATPCDDVVWSADAANVVVDEATMRAADPLPRCGACGGVARPNILMFGDGGWVEGRSAAQEARYRRWLAGVDPSAVVVVELGAGTAVPSVRYNSERLQARGATLVRINPREPQGPRGTIGIAGGALATLRAIDEAMRDR